MRYLLDQALGKFTGRIISEYTDLAVSRQCDSSFAIHPLHLGTVRLPEIGGGLKLDGNLRVAALHVATLIR